MTYYTFYNRYKNLFYNEKDLPFERQQDVLKNTLIGTKKSRTKSFLFTGDKILKSKNTTFQDDREKNPNTSPYINGTNHRGQTTAHSDMNRSMMNPMRDPNLKPMKKHDFDSHQLNGYNYSPGFAINDIATKATLNESITGAGNKNSKNIKAYDIFGNQRSSDNKSSIPKETLYGKVPIQSKPPSGRLKKRKSLAGKIGGLCSIAPEIGMNVMGPDRNNNNQGGTTSNNQQPMGGISPLNKARGLENPIRGRSQQVSLRDRTGMGDILSHGTPSVIDRPRGNTEKINTGTRQKDHMTGIFDNNNNNQNVALPLAFCPKDHNIFGEEPNNQQVYQQQGNLSRSRSRKRSVSGKIGEIPISPLPPRRDYPPIYNQHGQLDGGKKSHDIVNNNIHRINRPKDNISDLMSHSPIRQNQQTKDNSNGYQLTTQKNNTNNIQESPPLAIGRQAQNMKNHDGVADIFSGGGIDQNNDYIMKQESTGFRQRSGNHKRQSITAKIGRGGVQENPTNENYNIGNDLNNVGRRQQINRNNQDNIANILSHSPLPQSRPNSHSQNKDGKPQDQIGNLTSLNDPFAHRYDNERHQSGKNPDRLPLNKNNLKIVITNPLEDENHPSKRETNLLYRPNIGVQALRNKSFAKHEIISPLKSPCNKYNDLSPYRKREGNGVGRIFSQDKNIEMDVKSRHQRSNESNIAEIYSPSKGGQVNKVSYDFQAGPDDSPQKIQRKDILPVRHIGNFHEDAYDNFMRNNVTDQQRVQSFKGALDKRIANKLDGDAIRMHKLKGLLGAELEFRN